jgi:hypothetical protein
MATAIVSPAETGLYAKSSDGNAFDPETSKAFPDCTRAENQANR